MLKVTFCFKFIKFTLFISKTVSTTNLVLLIAKNQEKQFQDYDQETPNELTFYNVQELRNEHEKNPAQRKNKKINIVMNEADVVSQHESRLKIEVERYIQPQINTTSSESEMLNKKKIETTTNISPVYHPPPVTSKKVVERPTVSNKKRYIKNGR